MTNKSAEQQARDLLERMGIEDAQSFTSGDLVELANLIAMKNVVFVASGPLPTYPFAPLGIFSDSVAAAEFLDAYDGCTQIVRCDVINGAYDIAYHLGDYTAKSH